MLRDRRMCSVMTVLTTESSVAGNQTGFSTFHKLNANCKIRHVARNFFLSRKENYRLYLIHSCVLSCVLLVYCHKTVHIISHRKDNKIGFLSLRIKMYKIWHGMNLIQFISFIWYHIRTRVQEKHDIIKTKKKNDGLKARLGTTFQINGLRVAKRKWKKESLTT